MGGPPVPKPAPVPTPTHVNATYASFLRAEPGRRSEDGQPVLILWFHVEEMAKPNTLRLAVPVDDLDSLIQQATEAAAAFNPGG